MSKFSKLGLRRAAGAVAVTAAAVVGVASMGAGNAAAVQLANGYKTVSGLDGESVQTWRTGESGYTLPTVANNPLSKGFSISGVYTAKGSPGVKGKLKLGLIVGCQVDISGLGATLGGDASISSVGASVGISLPIKAGQVSTVSISDTDISDKGVASLQISNFQVTLPSCGGYAAARSFVSVWAANGWDPKGGNVNADGTLLKSTLYGQPLNVS